jgi:hypothetical protein
LFSGFENLIILCVILRHLEPDIILRCLKPHCIRCSHFKVDDVGALEASSKPPVHIVEDGVTALATYAMTLVMAWMP